MLTTTLPGFGDRIHDAQHTFRALLDALAHPGQVSTLAPVLTPPPGLTPACAGACLTLLDLETWIWLQPGCDPAVAAWLQFHTGCRLTGDPQLANFAWIWDLGSFPDLALFPWGTAETPESSTTIFVQVGSFQQGPVVRLRGPGILQERAIAPMVPRSFWLQWQANYRAYPLGVDGFLFSGQQVMGVPRTTYVEFSEGDG